MKEYYEVIIKSDNKTNKEKIEDLKQLKEILIKYTLKPVDIEVHKKKK